MKFYTWGVLGALVTMSAAAAAQVNLAGVGPAGNLRVGTFDGANSTDENAGKLENHRVVAVGHFTAMASYDVIVAKGGRFHRWSFNSANVRTTTLNLCPAPVELALSVGVGDFDADGNNGFVVQNVLNGRCFSYEIDNVSGAFTYRIPLGVPGNSAFNAAVGVVDANDDGAADIVVQNLLNRRVRFRLYYGVERGELSEALTDESGQVETPNGLVAGAARVNGNLYLFIQPLSLDSKKRVWQLNFTTVTGRGALNGWKPADVLSAVGN